MHDAKCLRDSTGHQEAQILPLHRKPTSPPDAMTPGLPSAEADAVAWLPTGARVLTRQGERPVEELRPGQVVMSLGEGPHWRPVERVVTRDVAYSGEEPEAAPLLIREGALMKGAPIRDMRVSPGLLLILDGAAVPASLLVNDVSILREPLEGTFQYHAVYLDAPAQLIVDGVLVESGSGGEAGRGVPPRLTEGPAFEALRARIEERALTLPQR